MLSQNSNIGAISAILPLPPSFSISFHLFILHTDIMNSRFPAIQKLAAAVRIHHLLHFRSVPPKRLTSWLRTTSSMQLSPDFHSCSITSFISEPFSVQLPVSVAVIPLAVIPVQTISNLIFIFTSFVHNTNLEDLSEQPVVWICLGTCGWAQIRHFTKST